MTPTPVDLFAEEITYNGLDISRIDQIGSCTAGLIRNRYSYDANHRLTQVDNTLFNPYETKDAFSASYSYDPAGNLISLKRNGWRDAVQDYVLIDDISYAYSGNNSVLTSVQEQTGLPEGLAASSHYSYDLNGNLIGDTGKGITQIDYNLLNLPVKVTGQGGGILEFEYTFGGEKIRKNNELEREYVGGLEYKNNVLELIHFPNGRIDKTGTVDTFQYYLTDHLGNIVVLFQDTDGDGAIALEEETNGAMDEVIQRNYYYSFGLRVDSPDFQIGDEPKNRYLYNGKELNEELDLNWLAYGFRWYDPAVGRFPSVDPLAEKYISISPYAFVANNPIIFIDPNGMELVLAGSINLAINDVKKLLRKKNRNRISFDNETGRVSLNTEGLTTKDFESNSGLQLVYDLVKAKEKYQYSVSEKAMLKIRKTGEIKEVDLTKSQTGLMNLSKTDFLEIQPGATTVSENNDAEVTIRPNLNFWEKTEDGATVAKSRESFVFHELQESFERTTNKHPYLYVDPENVREEHPSKKGAHSIAIDKEKNFYLKSHMPGKVTRKN
jgi:RHS repeat-associated protein